MNALVMGAVLFDVYPDAERIGGAPFNLACHLSRLGVRAAMFTRVGPDERAERALEVMRLERIQTEFVQRDAELPTGTAVVRFGPDGSPSYDLPRSAYDALDAGAGVLGRALSFQPEVLCYGTIEQRSEASRAAMAKLMDALNSVAFFDVNLRMGFIDKGVIERGLRRAQIVKVNGEEADILSWLLLGGAHMHAAFIQAIRREYAVDTVIVTLGADGCLVNDGDTVVRIPGVSARPGGDSVGAGDAFGAGFLFARRHGAAQAAGFANHLGAFVASHKGALPPYDDQIRSLIAQYA